MTKPLPSDDKTHQNNQKYLKRKVLDFCRNLWYNDTYLLYWIIYMNIFYLDND